MSRLDAPWWTAGDHLTTEEFALRRTQYAYKPADTSRSSTTTPAPDPDLVLTLDAGVWQLAVRALYSSGVNPRGISLGWAFGAADPTGVQPERLGYGPDPDSTSRTSTLAQTRATFRLSDAAEPPTGPRLYGANYGIASFAALREDGLMSLPERTTWAITWAQHTSSTAQVVLGAGSWIRARPITLLEGTP